MILDFAVKDIQVLFRCPILSQDSLEIIYYRSALRRKGEREIG